jgi:hypothetical protein
MIQLGDLKEWSLIILLFAIAFIFFVVGAVILLIVQAGDFDVTVSGNIDVGDYNVIIVGIAMVATVMVAQQLTKKQITDTVKENDESWHRSEGTGKSPP